MLFRSEFVTDKDHTWLALLEADLEVDDDFDDDDDEVFDDDDDFDDDDFDDDDEYDDEDDDLPPAKDVKKQ